MQNRLPASADVVSAPDLAQLLPQLGHELRTPVQVITGFVELLLAEQAGPLTAEQRRHLEQVQRSAARLARFAHELAAGEGAVSHPVRCEPASVERVLECVASALEPRLAARRQTLRIRIGRAARRGWFDPARLEQVLENLIANASEHGPAGSEIHLEVEHAAEHAGPALRVTVIDAGPGFDAAGPSAPGRGFGLSICRAILAAHGGQLELGHAPGRGTRASFTLPCVPECPS